MYKFEINALKWGWGFLSGLWFEVEIVCIFLLQKEIYVRNGSKLDNGYKRNANPLPFLIGFIISQKTLYNIKLDLPHAP